MGSGWTKRGSPGRPASQAQLPAYNVMAVTKDEVIGSTEVGHRLGIHPLSASRLIRQGKLRGSMVGRTWVVRAEDVERLARTYEGRRGRPRKRP